MTVGFLLRREYASNIPANDPACLRDPARASGPGRCDDSARLRDSASNLAWGLGAANNSVHPCDATKALGKRRLDNLENLSDLTDGL